jgi:hypothetical protein
MKNERRMGIKMRNGNNCPITALFLPFLFLILILQHPFFSYHQKMDVFCWRTNEKKTKDAEEEEEEEERCKKLVGG